MTSSFIQVVLDGLMMVATLIIMLVYAPILSFIVFAAITLYALLRIAIYAPFRRASGEQIEHATKQASLFLETLCGIQSIKFFGKRDLRLSGWQNLAVDNMNRGIAIKKCHSHLDRLTTYFLVLKIL